MHAFQYIYQPKYLNLIMYVFPQVSPLTQAPPADLVLALPTGGESPTGLCSDPIRSQQPVFTLSEVDVPNETMIASIVDAL